MRLTWGVAAGLAALGGLAATAATATAWTATAPRPGITLAAVVAVVALVGAVQTAAVAIVGEYVVRTYREAQGRPTSVIRRTITAAGTRSGTGTKAA